jgi:hypothetical protein
MEVTGQGKDYDEAEKVEARSTKRRRTSSLSPQRGEDDFVWQDANLVANFDGAAGKGKQRMESTYGVPGTQMSAFKHLQRRELGFHSTRTQRMSFFLSSSRHSSRALIRN